MREYERLGHMQVATRDPKPGGRVYYIPHHPVTAKFRVVFDASCKTTSGKSFNDIQLVGEKLQYDLADVIVRLRRHKIGISADIKKMFRQVGIDPEQWDCQRIFWRESPAHSLKEYWLTVVTYGMSSSVHSSVRAMRQCAADHSSDWPQAAQGVHDDFYVDDCFTGADNVPEATKLCQDLDALLRSGGFELAKWATNNPDVLQALRSGEDIVELSDDQESKVLGLRWVTAHDELTFRVVKPGISLQPSKREVLSEIAKLYNPNGFLSPIIINAKIIMQDLWRLGIGWDEAIPAPVRDRWNKFHQSLDQLSQVRLPRWLGISEGIQIQLHGFADASAKAYGAAIYVRTTNAVGISQCHLAASKSRVASLAALTIPRMELAAAELLGRLMKKIAAVCKFTNAKCYYWSDSTVVLGWLKRLPCELKTFVANRVASIQTSSQISDWAHVASSDNAADLLSRGMEMSEFVNSTLWFHGPDWLRLPESSWPRSKPRLSDETIEKVNLECKPTGGYAVVGTIKTGSQSLLYRYSTWNKVMRITAYVLRFVANCRHKHRVDRANGIMLTSDEITGAVNYWSRNVQCEHFAREVQCRQLGESLPARSKISGLNPRLNTNGVLCVGGRLSRTNRSDENKHHIIIPAQSRLGWLLLQKAHCQTLHGGVQMMMRYIRSDFWIPRLRAEARMFVGRCVTCFRMSKRTETQLMGELPSDRVRPARPFYKTGVDFAGPYELKLRPGRPKTRTQSQDMRFEKGYVAVFVCLVTRAIHLEAVTGMTSEAFIAAFSRFISRRGFCAYMYSDNGTTFVGADKEMCEAIKTWQQRETLDFVQSKGTEWRFITPGAPFQGGIWEAAVKSMKYHLRRVMGTQKYSYEALTTLLTQVEACLNSRPICAMSDDVDDVRALTPAHFLIGEEMVLPLPIIRSEPSRNLNALWQQVQYDVQCFWSQWNSDYLDELQVRRKWRNERRNVMVGQLALLKNENFPPTYWALGKVVEVRPGEDGLVRSATILVDGRHYDRPIQKLCILPMDDELDYWN